MKIFNLFLFGIVLLFFATAFYFYSSLPDRMADHWNSQGEINGYSSKFWGLFLIPFLAVLALVFYFVLPFLDPLRKNLESFRKYIDFSFLLFELFFYYVFLLIIFSNLGYSFDFIYLIIPALAILLFYVGILMQKSKRNYFIGIRTPWTLSSDVVWNSTHKKGGFLFKLTALITLIGLFFKSLSLYFFLIPLFLSSFYLVVYSYLKFKKLKK